ncbi:MAG: hypothetical protein U5K29_09715 [Acidimicrobiales bacterium]|nr:hypothetical protein [Acidimicrobiales bacterium]
MPTSSTPLPEGSSARRLFNLAEVLEAAHHRSPDPRASLVKVRGLDTDAFELALAPIADRDVYDALLGATVPDDFDAAGFVVRGTARSLGDPDRRLAPGERLGRASTAVLCSRDGTVASALRVNDDEPLVQVVSETTSPEAGVGRLLDVLRRSLGLATPAPLAPVHTVSDNLWLHRVLQAAVGTAHVDRSTVDALRPRLPATWTDLRWQCGDGSWPELEVDPELARWMDEGMFARVCLGAFADPLEVTVELSELLAPDVWSHLVARLATRRTDPLSGAGNLAPRVR